MSRVYDDIESLKKLIDRFVQFLIVNDRVGIGTNMAVLTHGLGAVLPEIIALYDDERMSEYADDKDYWPAQLERIIGALEIGDFFMAYDALVHELVANLTEIQKIIKVVEMDV